jgi:pyruvate dehydrogenase E1 component
MYLYAAAGPGDGPRAQILASGVSVPWALEAQRMLHDEWGVFADVWSVTSWNELRRDAVESERANILGLGDGQVRVPYVTSRLLSAQGPVVAVSDWMRAVPDQIAQYVPGDFSSLGTDGWGLSDTRGALRRHFLVDAPSIVTQVLSRLALAGQVHSDAPRQAFAKYQLDNPQAADMGSTAGDS